MKKARLEAKSGTIKFSIKALEDLQLEGYKFVQIKGLTIDMHYDYVDPHILILIPFRELPTDPLKRDIYEPIKSKLLYKWANEINEYPQIVIGNDISKKAIDD